MGVTITDGFSPGDDEKVVSILSKWNGGILSDKLFAEISKMTPQLSVIIIVFRKNGEKLETLLLKRPDDDPVWPGILNLPGKMFRSIDFKREDKNPVNGPLERIQKDEIKMNLGLVKYVGLAFQNTLRGPIMVLVHVAFLPMDIMNENWIWRDVDTMDKFNDMIPTEIDAMKVALKAI